MSRAAELNSASRTLIFLFMVLAFAFACSPGGAQGATTKTCGELGRLGELGPEIVTTRAKGGVGCKTARSVLRAHIAGSGSPLWECHSAGSEASCTDANGRWEVNYGPAAGVRNCGRVGFSPNSDDGAFEIRAKRVPCARAKHLARDSKRFSVLNGATYRSAGFRCTGSSVDDVPPSVFYVCQRNARRTVVFIRT